MTASTRLRQVALVAADLEKAAHQLKTVIGSEVIYIDPAVEQWGLRNVIFPIGGDMLEVVSPFKPDTTASRLLSKRGDGGYMIIMQTGDAKAQTKHLVDTGLAKVIFSHENEDSVCIQYHPKGFKGSIIPELDSHRVTAANPTPLLSRFSPWHALGPLSNFPAYSKQMRQYSHLSFVSITCRLAPNDADVSAANHQWKEMFRLHTVGGNGECDFMNKVKLIFLPGQEGKKEGLVEISIGVEGSDRLYAILERARAEGLLRSDGWVEMVGIRWRFAAIGGLQAVLGSKI